MSHCYRARMVARTDPSTPPPFPHDAAYKAMYSHPRVVEDALRAYAAGPGGVLGQQTLAALDFSTLRKLPAEWVTADFRRRHGDQVWCIRWRGRARGEDTVAGSVLILLEFQSREDPDMALRINGYTLDLYRDLEAQRIVRSGAPRPPVLSIVIHNGASRWTAPTGVSELIALSGAPGQAGAELAALQPSQRFYLLDFAAHRQDDLMADNIVSLQIGFEHARGAEALAPLVRALLAVEDGGLKRTMYAWVRLLGERHRMDLPPMEELEAMGSLDEFRSRFDEKVRGWTEQWFAEGVERGLEQGLAQGVERGLEQGLAQGVERGLEQGLAEGVERGLEQGLAEGVERGLEQGLAQGVERGLEQGLAQGAEEQRVLLHRLASVKFGAATAERLSPLLAQVTTPATFTEIGEWMIECSTEAELISRVDAVVTPSLPPASGH